jgi:tRNA threonylcarbamoyladenosine modification (KEOPS) complex  Pcc1 subunit
MELYQDNLIDEYMDVVCEIVIEFENVDKAKKIFRSIEVDNFNFVTSRTHCTKLEAKIQASSVSSLLHTLDDYLACVSVAMKVVDKS